MFLAKNLTQPMNLAMFFAICSVVTYAVTSIIKPLTKSRIKNQDLRKFVIQLFSCASGGFVGYEMSGYATLGLWLGFGSGALNVIVVTHLKNKLTSNTEHINLETPPPSEASSPRNQELPTKASSHSEEDFD